MGWVGDSSLDSSFTAVTEHLEGHGLVEPKKTMAAVKMEVPPAIPEAAWRELSHETPYFGNLSILVSRS